MSLFILLMVDHKFINVLIYILGDSISNNQLETNTILKGDDYLPNSMASGKLISSIALTKPLSSEQQKKRAAMLFGKLYS